MTALRTGAAIFAAALASLPRRPLPALLLLAGVTAGDFALVRSGLAFASGLFGLLEVVLGAMLIGVAASVWHRIVLRPDVPAVAIGVAARYGVAWFMLGLGIFLCLVPLVLVLWLVGLLLSFDPLATMDEAFGVVASGPNWPMAATFVAGSWLFLVLLYRWGMGLPHLAVTPDRLGISESWERTAPLAGPIAVLALIAALLQTPAFVVLPYLPLSEGDDVPIWFDLLSSGSHALIVLVGAALLTELYRRTAVSR